MKLRNLFSRCTALLLSLSVLLSLTACGGKKEEMAAATMHLKRTEGKVTVSDDGGGDVPLLDNLGLYSGYGVKTRSESYAWINLDDVKLTKMDEDSRITIEQSGKELEIKIKSGGLFFNVTEPLGDDETMNIRTSTMLVGIRGTCGWVVDQDEVSRVYLLEGKVKCSANGESEQVQAGEMATVAGDGAITVTGFTAQDIPAFVYEEVEEDEDLAKAILDASGIDVLASPGPGDAQSPEGSTGPEPLPTDGDRIVFTGTINSYTYDEVLAAQGRADPNAGYYTPERDGIYHLIVLDTPQNMTLNTAGGDGLRDGMVKMISTGLEGYNGQHLIFSIDPYQTYWPSDVSLPLDEPRTGDVHVLGTAGSAGAGGDTGTAGALPAELANLTIVYWGTPREGEFLEFGSGMEFRYRSQGVLNGPAISYNDVWTVSLDRVEKTGDHTYTLYVASVPPGTSTEINLRNDSTTTTTADSSACPFKAGDAIKLVLPTTNGGTFSVNGTQFELFTD